KLRLPAVLSEARQRQNTTRNWPETWPESMVSGSGLGVNRFLGGVIGIDHSLIVRAQRVSRHRATARRVTGWPSGTSGRVNTVGTPTASRASSRMASPRSGGITSRRSARALNPASAPARRRAIGSRTLLLRAYG